MWVRAARLCTRLKKALKEPRDLPEQLSPADVGWQGSRWGALLSPSTHGSGKGERQGLRRENRGRDLFLWGKLMHVLYLGKDPASKSHRSRTQPACHSWHAGGSSPSSDEMRNGLREPTTVPA